MKIYWNVREKNFSVKNQNGVLLHASKAAMKDVSFHVVESTRRRIIHNKRKEVCAWAEGELVHLCHAKKDEMTQVSFNPYKQGFFYCTKTNRRIDKAELALFYKGKVFIKES